MGLEEMRSRAVRRAERASSEGYREGRYVLDGEISEVFPLFYPNLVWMIRSGEVSRPLTLPAWSRCEPASVKIAQKDVRVLDRHDGGPSIFISDKLPGGGGVPHLAIWVGEQGFFRTYRAVALPSGEPPEDLRTSFEGKDSLLVVRDLKGFTLVEKGEFPEDDLPGPLAENSETPEP